MIGAHEASERIQAPLHSNLIAMNSQAEEVREWYYFTATSKGGGELGKVLPGAHVSNENIAWYSIAKVTSNPANTFVKTCACC